ncbi:MAG: hypothetical protein ABSC50_00965 [Candidatus Bathyarchaeia archaeon]
MPRGKGRFNFVDFEARVKALVHAEKISFIILGLVSIMGFVVWLFFLLR